MRLFLLPLSTRRILVYGQRLNVTTTQQQGLLDKGTARAARLWADWEKKESGWQKKIVDYGNQALKRIPYEEWGLKSIPPFSARRKAEELKGKGLVEVSFPPSLIPAESVNEVLRNLGTERQDLHKQRMVYSIIGMPLVAPFALIPVIPNLPFFYLVFRAWSHWRAFSGSKHITFLLDNNLITPKPSKILDDFYSTEKASFGHTSVEKTEKSSTTSGVEVERMVLHMSDGKRIARALQVPELETELDRAVWQVETAIKAERELREEKARLDSVNPESKEKK